MSINWVNPKRRDDLDLPPLTNCLEVRIAYCLAALSWPVAIAGFVLQQHSLITNDTAAASAAALFGLNFFALFEWFNYQLFGRGFFRSYWLAVTKKGVLREQQRILQIGFLQVLRQRRFEALDRKSSPS